MERSVQQSSLSAGFSFLVDRLHCRLKSMRSCSSVWGACRRASSPCRFSGHFLADRRVYVLFLILSKSPEKDLWTDMSGRTALGLVFGAWAADVVAPSPSHPDDPSHEAGVSRPHQVPRSGHGDDEEDDQNLRLGRDVARAVG